MATEKTIVVMFLGAVVGTWLQAGAGYEVAIMG
jgi:hypothetical protein